MDRGDQAASHAGYNLYTVDYGGRRYVVRRRRQPEGFRFYSTLPPAIARNPMVLLDPPPPQTTQSAAAANDGAGRRINKRARVAEATEAAIQGLPEVAMPPAAAECTVCLKDFDELDKLRAMPCAHAFHQDCIFRWLRRNATCPLCRHLLSSEAQETA
ncbi:hypothetical protein PR202_ga04136 [Eleusine coracana subsp. coracana]|uniref:RING-type domain-containing protein n=1 Tax=Eleusine coracana subsp. coracana TaxID=191504 RepID=A0AAV5BNW6_ELECO|nr:hypothetical protein PR202_ga04136 [Eleusine coracana subsp. coracana]